MKIYVIPWKGNIPSGAERPCFSLMDDNWDDYSYETTFILNYHYIDNNGRGKRKEFGAVKILDKTLMITALPNIIENELSNNFCSLGQEPLYYEKMNQLPVEDKYFVLKTLRDVVFNNEVYSEFKNEEGFKTSLLRFGTAEKALVDGRNLLVNQKGSKEFDFTFSFRVNNANEDHVVNFDFKHHEYLPYRINSIIGKNGTGKTQCLSRLANVLSGQKKDVNIGKFSNGKPLFDKIIAISYSAFDNIEKPEETAVFSYKYCGLHSTDGLLTKEKLKESINKSLEIIFYEKRNNDWIDALHMLMNYDDRILRFKERKAIYDINAIFPDEILSSGQMMIISIITDIMANIRWESLILFDEPENHLHPNAISGILKTIYSILEKFNSYAIISSHSPLLLREVPKKYIRVFERHGNRPVIGEVDFETFGGSIGEITSSIFNVIEHESLYKSRLREMATRLGYEETLRNFDDDLSISAKIFLKNIVGTSEES